MSNYSLYLNKKYPQLQSYLIEQFEKKLQITSKIPIRNRKLLSIFKNNILSVERKLFVQTIVMIKQLEGDLAIVFFQYPYDNISIKVSIIKLILGNKSYEKKIKKYNLLQKNCQQYKRTKKQTFISQIKVCHQCSKIIIGKDYPCLSKQKVKPQITSEYIHPYFSYSCNRSYCEKCYTGIRRKQNEQPFQFCCLFCLRECKCLKCCKGNWIMKSYQIYQMIVGSTKQLIEQFIFPQQNDTVEKIGFTLKIIPHIISRQKQQRKLEKQINWLRNEGAFISQSTEDIKLTIEELLQPDNYSKNYEPIKNVDDSEFNFRSLSEDMDLDIMDQGSIIPIVTDTIKDNLVYLSLEELLQVSNLQLIAQK